MPGVLEKCFLTQNTVFPKETTQHMLKFRGAHRKKPLFGFGFHNFPLNW